MILHNIKLQNLSDTDALTGLPNRRYLELQLAKIENTENTDLDSMISILMIDVNHFKQFNDFYGHSAGDLALKSVAATLQTNIQNATYFVARFGGEEFIMVLQQTDKYEAFKVARRLRKKIQDLHIKHQRSVTNELLTVCIGIADQKLNQHFHFDKLFKKADDALYQAKDAGRNTIIVSGQLVVKNLNNNNQTDRQFQHIEDSCTNPVNLT